MRGEMDRRKIPALVSALMALVVAGGLTAPAGAQGLADPIAAKAAHVCQNAVTKAGSTFAVKKLASLAKCARGAFACVQTKPGNQGCLAKAGTKCAAELDKIGGAEAQLRAVIAQKCGALAPSDLLAANGLGYVETAPRCLTDFGIVASDVPAIAECVEREHECHVERLFASSAPRAKELMRVAGVDPLRLDALTCLDDHGGAGAGFGDPASEGKTLLGCQTAISKAGARLLASTLATIALCVDGALDCVERKPGDATCLTKMHLKCDKAFAKIAPAPDAVERAVDKRCEDLALSTLADDAALGAIGATCSELGVLGFLELRDYEECLFRRHRCEIESMLLFQAPRAAELLGLTGRGLRSPFCPLPPGAGPACQVEINDRFRRFDAPMGTIFFDRTVDFTYGGGTVLLARDSDGTGSVFVDDEIIVTVTHPDTTTAVYDHDYSTGCSGTVTSTAPTDLSAFFQSGTNHVRVEFRNTCGANASADSYWLVSPSCS